MDGPANSPQSGCARFGGQQCTSGDCRLCTDACGATLVATVNVALAEYVARAFRQETLDVIHRVNAIIGEYVR